MMIEKRTIARCATGEIRVVGLTHDAPIIVEHIQDPELCATYIMAVDYKLLMKETEMYHLSRQEIQWLTSPNIKRLIKEFKS